MRLLLVLQRTVLCSFEELELEPGAKLCGTKTADVDMSMSSLGSRGAGPLESAIKEAAVSPFLGLITCR